MAKLFMQEVPEIYDGIVEIISVARDPGSRAKIAVHTSENSIDPVGACVGMRGSRVQSVVNELQGEKIDIVKWSPDIATFVISSLAPAEATKVVLDEEIERIEVVVPDDHLSLAIGRRGQNVRLASQLTKWDIDILTEAEESERRQNEFNEKSEIFIQALDVDEVIAQLLVSEGFLSIEDLVFVETSEISSIEGFDDDTAVEIQSRAKTFIEEESKKQDAKRKELGVQDDLAQIDGMTTNMLVSLGENDIKTLDDFAGCSTDELFGWVEKTELGSKKQNGLFTGFDITMEKIEEMILHARLKLGWIAEEDEVNLDNDDQRVGVNIVRKALQSPARQIAENAGEDGAVIAGKILENKAQNYGFDAQNEKYCDMVKNGIIDPAKVVRAALQDAASVAGLLITTEAMVADVPENNSGGGMPGGGMPDMGGMGGMGM